MYLLMQIHFWVYNEKELKEKLELKEMLWEYKNIQNTTIFNEELEFKISYEEYLKLQLMRKDTKWAFDWLKIEKIYDKDWSDEKNKEHIEEINKEFWEEVIVME